MDSVYIVMPAYNEEDNIEKVVKQWYPVLDGKGDNSRLVIADSGSTDGTHAILEKIRGGSIISWRFYPRQANSMVQN